MLSAKIVVLLAGAAAAQSSVTILNFYQADPTLTLRGSDSGATTYENVCAPTSSGAPHHVESSSIIIPSASGLPSITSSDSEATTAPSSDALTLSKIFVRPTQSFIHLSGMPAPTPRALLRRHDDDDGCEPYTLIQGPETWQFHLTDPVPGALTLDGDCSWKGELTAATVTCTITQNGTILDSSGITSSTINPSELSSFEAIRTVAIVSAVTTGGNFNPTSHAATPSSSPTGTVTHSSGIAPPRALPTGAIVFVGGAAGLFAAAVAL